LRVALDVQAYDDELGILPLQVIQKRMSAFAMRAAFAMKQDDLVARGTRAGRADSLRSLRGGGVRKKKEQHSTQDCGMDPP
jgi:hypothetical protein